MHTKLQRKLLRVSRDLIHLPVSDAKHFTFICDGNKILSVGYNNGWKTHPAGAKFGHRFAATHSELAAIVSYKGHIQDLKRLTFYNVRLWKNGIVSMAKPCEPCQNMLNAFGVGRLYYTNRNGDFVQWNS